MDTAVTDGPSLGAPPPGEDITRLTVLYDERCAFCRRCRDWLLTQPCFPEVELVAAGSEMARERYGSLPWLGQELLVADQHGRVWIGPAAFLVCLWATVRYRSWAYRLSGPTLAPLATRFFMHISKRRDRWSAWVREDPDCSWCDQVRLAHGP
jgi:predicted DCC family thiol-disulfide oxidoreductase YuxK